SYTWLSDADTGNAAATRVVDASSQVTTLLFNLDRNISSVIGPLGQSRDYRWQDHRLLGYRDGNGNRTTLLYTTLPDRTSRLHVLIDALGGRYTLGYAGGQLRLLIDQVSQRATLVWDDNDNRIGLIDPLGQRTSFLFNESGQNSAVIDP